MTIQSNSNAVELRSIDFSYSKNHDFQPLFHDFSLKAATGEVVAVMGSSGSGKSTLGRLIARMVKPQSGEIIWSTAFTHSRELVYIDQQPFNSIFPWQTVRRNLAYPLRKLGCEPDYIKQRTELLLRLFRLDQLGDAFPANLSGGELQRLALARCLSWKPQCAILDESFSALDGTTKNSILSAIRELAGTETMTLVLITHNLGDALAIADRCVLLGNRPVQIVADVGIPLGFPRQEHSGEYRETQARLLNIIRDAIL